MQITKTARSPGSTDHPQRASRHGRRPYLLHALRKLKIGCSAPRQDFDVLSGHHFIFSKSYTIQKHPERRKIVRGVLIQRINYLTMLATSLAKSSFLFSRPSPFSKRTKSVTFIVPPAFFASSAMYCSTERSPFLTNACCRRQLFS